MSIGIEKFRQMSAKIGAAGFASRAVSQLTAKGGVSEPGMCWAWVRRDVVEPLGLPSPGPGMDAKQAGHWYRDNGFAVEHDGFDNSKVGDIIFWFDGNHGHVGIRIPGNKIAENSSVHSSGGSDARGTRHLANLRKPDCIVRLARG